MNNYYFNENDLYRRPQAHTHEYLGSVEISRADPHVHRVSGVSGEAVASEGGHVHEIMAITTYNDGHIHHIKVRTGLQIPVSSNKHVHFLKGVTTSDDGHTHNFEMTTLND